jgi:tocopherol O-methyltransferase
MIYPREQQKHEHVAVHYDDLSKWYLEIWGEHVHHGLWETGGESPELAVQQLTQLIARATGITKDSTVVDIGCGYGGTARILANGFGADVTGYTLSQAQYDYAVARTNGDANPHYHLQSWFENDLPDGFADVVISIESSEHMEDKPRFFAEIARVLKPGGRFGVYAWLARDNPSRRQVDWLLEPICREGRLPSMGNEEDYRRMMWESGLVDIAFRDLSRNVRKTWPMIVGRMAKRLLHDREAWHFMFHGPNRVFGITVFRIWAAYYLNVMRYGLFTCKKPC